MKKLTTLLALTGIMVVPFWSGAEEKKAEAKAEKAKAYPLKTCVVSDEKLGDMGEPYVFIHEGREYKLCCKSCLKSFKKEPAKFLKKVEDAEKKAAKKS